MQTTNNDDCLTHKWAVEMVYPFKLVRSATFKTRKEARAFRDKVLILNRRTEAMIQGCATRPHPIVVKL